MIYYCRNLLRLQIYTKYTFAFCIKHVFNVYKELYDTRLLFAVNNNSDAILSALYFLFCSFASCINFDHYIKCCIACLSKYFSILHSDMVMEALLELVCDMW